MGGNQLKGARSEVGGRRWAGSTERCRWEGTKADGLTAREDWAGKAVLLDVARVKSAERANLRMQIDT